MSVSGPAPARQVGCRLVIWRHRPESSVDDDDMTGQHLDLSKGASDVQLDPTSRRLRGGSCPARPGGLWRRRRGGRRWQGGDNKIVVWTGDTIPDRVAKTKAIIAKFTEATGVQVELVGVDEDQFNQLLTSAAAAGELPDVVGSQPLAAVRTLSANDLLNTEAAAAVIETLGADTFSARSLELTREGDDAALGPDRRLVAAALLPQGPVREGGSAAPGDVRRHHGGGQGAGQPQGGRVRRGHHSRRRVHPADVRAPRAGQRLRDGRRRGRGDDRQPAVRGGVPVLRRPDQVSTRSSGTQDVDTVRASYFAGQSAMAIWSTFLLDELAGLRNDAKPSCPECKEDPKFLAENTGVVAAIAGPDGTSRRSSARSPRGRSPRPPRPSRPRSSSSTCSATATSTGSRSPPRASSRCARAPQENPTEYVDAWKDLEVGVDTKAPLSDFYPQEVIDILTSGADNFSRWGITQGQGDLIGASLGELPVPKAIGALTAAASMPRARPSRPPTNSRTIKKSLRVSRARRRRRRAPPVPPPEGQAPRRAGPSAGPAAGSGGPTPGPGSP